MDIEFHYYMMCLVAGKAGFGPVDAYTIAYASQYVDDNDMKLEIDKDRPSAYRNYISQTMNILKPKSKLFRIYPFFHFVPGDPMRKTAFRKDGKMHWLNTTPDSKNANKIMDAAIETENLYRIGVACHSYADTWAHQNFVGYYDEFNSMASPLGQITPDIGHADARHNPDWPSLVWRDERLLDERRENKSLFLVAAGHILQKLIKFVDGKITKKEIIQKKKELVKDLGKAIGDRDQNNSCRLERIVRYREVSARNGYGAMDIPEYDSDRWLAAALDEDVRGLRDRSDFTLARWDPLRDIYSWADRKTYKQTDWYRFQEAVKGHQGSAWEILRETNLKGLQLPQF